VEKPRSAAGYPPEGGEHARAACLYVATVLGDLLIEELVVVGGTGVSLRKRLDRNSAHGRLR